MEFPTRNPHMIKLFEQAQALAGGDHPILLQGEAGTGREALARYIHERSGRAEAPFVRLEGAGTAPGLQSAAGGTAFVAEVTEETPESLARLVREAGQAGARLIAAASMEVTGWEGLVLILPPLRERKEDLELLTHKFLLELVAPGAMPPTLTAEAMAAMLLHEWPGNLRELKRVLFRAMVQSGAGSQITVHDLPRGLADRLQQGPPRQLFKRYMRSAEKLLIGWALTVCEQDRTRSAKFLGLSRAALYKKLKLYPELAGSEA